VPDGAGASAIGVVGGHGGGPDAEDALIGTAAGGPDLGLGRGLALGADVPVAMGDGVVHVGEGGGVHFVAGEEVEVDDAGFAVDDADGAFFVFAEDGGVDAGLFEEGFAAGGDGAGDDDFGVGELVGDGLDHVQVVRPGGGSAFDEDVVEAVVEEELEVRLVAFAEGDGVAEGHLGAGHFGDVGGGVAHEHGVGQVGAELELVGLGGGEEGEGPAGAGADAGLPHIVDAAALILHAGGADPPGGIREEDAHGKLLDRR